MNKSKFNQVTSNLEDIALSFPTDKELMTVLFNSTRGPWKDKKRDDDLWEISQTNEKVNRIVALFATPYMNNYDRRLIALAPVLAWEVAHLRAALRKSQELKVNIELRQPVPTGFNS